MEKMILASGSPRRRELLEQAGISFEVIKSDAEEKMTETEPQEIVKELSLCKARTVADMHPGRLVLGADTIVVLDKQVLGKPETKEHAVQMLRAMQGRTHQVYTGVTLIRNEQVVSFYEKTEVTFYPMTDDDILSYVESGDCMDKAGAYGIQGRFAVHIKEIHGDYYNVMGLPIGKLWHEMRACGMTG